MEHPGHVALQHSRPLLLHSNGAGANGKKLGHEAFGPLRQRIWPPTPEALEQQVLLLDSQAGGACSLLSLSALLNQSAASCAAEPACRAKLGIKGR